MKCGGEVSEGQRIIRVTQVRKAGVEPSPIAGQDPILRVCQFRHVRKAAYDKLTE